MFAAIAAPTLNSYMLIRDRVIVGNYPNDFGDRESILGASVTHFVDLTHPTDQLAPYKVPVHYELFPIEDGSIAHDNELASLVRRIAYVLESDNTSKYYIHCRGGYGRAGTVAACLLQQLFGITGHESLSLLRLRNRQRSIGGHHTTPQTPEQILQVLRYQRLGEVSESMNIK